MFRPTIRTRVTVIFAALATVPLLLVGIILGWQGFQQQQQQVLITQSEIAKRFATNVSTFFAGLEQEAHIVLDVHTIAQLSADEQRHTLIELLSYEGDFNELTTVDAQGQQKIDVSRFSEVSSGGQSDWSAKPEFTIPKNSQQTYYSPVTFNDVTGEPEMTIAVPFFDANRQVLGVLIANARIKKIWDLLKTTDLGSAESVYIIDSQNRVIAHPDPSLVLKTTYFTPPSTPGFYKGLKGDNVFLVTENIKLGSQILTVITEENATAALFPAITTVLIILVITIVASIIASLLGLVAAQQIARPIQSLAAATHNISQGDLSQRVEVASRDEIGDLAKAFDGMRLRLRETLENLEQRVNDRTRDLQLAVDVSRQITTVLDIHELMEQVVVQISKGFGFYSTAVWLAQGDMLKVAAAAAEQGQLVPSIEGDNMPITTEPSIIALAARSHKAVNVNNTSQSPNFLPHDVLPETLSELCIPMLLGDHLLGVFDIQSRQANRFGSDDVRVLTALAEQIAIAVRNAQLFADVQAARQEAERANKVKSQFLASMSHELRTPLNAILNFSQFVATGVMGPVNNRQVETLTSVITSGKHLLNLINDVLDISKIESGTLKLYVQSGLKPNEILDWSGRMAESLLENKSIQLIMDVEGEMPDLVGDERRIRQIMLNLISNACKFTEQGSVSIGGHREGENILFYVRDTGPGIAASDFDAVFETFQQTETGLRHGGGTGLGLPISRKLAEAHGGRLWLESTLGIGTTFYVTLPIDSEILVPLNSAVQPPRKDKNAE